MVRLPCLQKRQDAKRRAEVAALPAQGRYLLALFTNTAWAVRRVERARHLNLSQVDQRTSVDIDLRVIRSRAVDARLSSPSDLLLPVALFEKKLHLDFDVQMVDGSPVQLLTTSENSALSAAMLEAFLTSVDCPPELLKRLTKYLPTLAGPPRDETQSVGAIELLKALGLEDEDAAEIQKLPGVEELLDAFASNYLGIIRVTDPDTRSFATVKYRFIEDTGEWKPTFLERMGLGFPWIQYRGQVGLAGSDHRIFEVPPGLVMDASLATVVDEQGQDIAIEQAPEIVFRERVSPKSYVVQLRADRRYAFGNSLQVTPGLGEFYLPALMSVCFTVFLLGVGLWLELTGCALSSTKEASAIATILALVPSVLNAYLALPGEHPMVARLHALPRALVFLVAVAAVSAAGAVALNLGAEVIRVTLWVTSVYTALVALLLFIVVVRVSFAQRQHSPNAS